MQQLEEHFAVISSIPSSLYLKNCCVNVDYVYRRTVELLIDCYMGRYAAVVMDSDQFLERSRAIKNALGLLEPLQAALQKRKLPRIQEKFNTLVYDIESLDI